MQPLDSRNNPGRFKYQFCLSAAVSVLYLPKYPLVLDRRRDTALRQPHAPGLTRHLTSAAPVAVKADSDPPRLPVSRSGLATPVTRATRPPVYEVTSRPQPDAAAGAPT